MDRPGYVGTGADASCGAGLLTCRDATWQHQLVQQPGGQRQQGQAGPPPAAEDDGEEQWDADVDAGYCLPEDDVIRPFAPGRPMVLPSLGVALAASRANMSEAEWSECESFVQQAPQLMREALQRLPLF